MSKIAVDDITDAAGTGAPNFPNGATGLPDPFGYTAVSGATQALDVGTYNFFDAGTLTADTTVSFSNVPTEARWTYSFVADAANGFDIVQAPQKATYDFSAQASNGVSDVVFKTDGTKLYMIDNISDVIYQYDVSLPWDVSTASYASKSFDTGSQLTSPTGVFFKPDGTKMYVSGNANDRVYQYTLSTAWDVSTASYDSKSLYMGSQELYPSCVFINTDGTRLYTVGDYQDGVIQYNLSTAWDVSSGSYSKMYTAGSLPSPQGVAFTPDGTKMYVMSDGFNELFQHTLSTAWEVDTVSYDSVYLNVNSIGDPVSVHFSPEGARMYICSYTKASVYQYDTGAPPTVTLPSSVYNTPSTFSVGDVVAFTFFTADGGTTVKLIN